MSPEQAFLESLSLNDRTWLGQLWHQVQHQPPAHWISWSMSGGDQPIHLGFLSPTRAHWLQVHLQPQLHCISGQLFWPSGQDGHMARSEWLDHVLHLARQQELVTGWRDELYAWWPNPAIPPRTDQPPAFVTERAGFRHLGLLSHAVHIHGFTSDGDLWCAKRSMDKATDPGLFDNLAAGGLSAGEDPFTAAMRELQEEAGLQVDAAQLIYKGSVRTCRREAEGWHNERLLVFSLQLQENESPYNLDGEVEYFERLKPVQWMARLRHGLFTADAAAALVCALGLTPPSIR